MSNEAWIIVLALNLASWLGLAVYRDLAACMRDDQNWNTPLWNKYNDQWHYSGALQRGQNSLFMILTVLHYLVKLNVAFSVGIWVLCMVLFWLGFDYLFNKWRGVDPWKVGEKAWLDRNTTILANYLGKPAKAVGIALKLSLIILLTIYCIIVW